MNAKKRPQAVTEGEWVGQCLRYWRTKVGFRQADLADLMREELGTPWKQGIVANVEAGSRAVSLVELMALCVALGVSLNEFLFPDSEDKAAPFIEYVKMPDQVALVRTNALGETLHGGLDADTADAWSDADIHRAVLDLADVVAHTYELRGDPDLALLRDEMPGAVDDDRLRDLIDAVYREQFPKGRFVASDEDQFIEWLRRRGDEESAQREEAKKRKRPQRQPYTATQLVDALTEQFEDEQRKKARTAREMEAAAFQRARNATRAHARNKAATLIMRKALEQ